jgi:outer membrane receptor protein involved in Fe transport
MGLLVALLGVLSSAAAQEEQAPLPEASTASEAAPAEILPTIPVPESQPTELPPEIEEATDATRLEEVVVTATKRRKLLREIAGSVGAVSGAALEKMGAKDMESYLKLIPGVSFNKQEDGRAAPTIRGIGSDTRLVIAQSTTGIYIDDMPFTDPYLPGATADLNPYDLERVEVLKGPQGTLYGSSSLGGAIRYITQKPRLGVWEGKLSGSRLTISEGSEDYSGAGAINIPLGNELAVRVAGVKQNLPGYIDDLSIDKNVVDSNRKEQTLARALATWQPLDWPLSVTGSYMQQTTKTFESGFADQEERLERSNTPGPNTSNIEVGLANLSVKYDFDWGSVLSSTSQSDKLLDWVTDSARAFGLSGQALIKFPAPTYVESESIAQELRISSPDGSDPWEWMGGLWFMKHDQFMFLSIPTTLPSLADLVAALPTLVPGLPLPALPPLPLPALPPLPDVLDLYNQYTNSIGTEKALFGEITRKFGERWSLTAGGRYYRTELEAHSTTNGLLVVASSQMPSAQSDFTINEEGFNPKVSLKYELNRNVVTYALVSKGFRFGGVQVLPPPPIPDPSQEVPSVYNSDTLWNYELGARSEWFKRRLAFDVTVFYDKWTDLQIAQIANSGLFNFVDNVGAAHTQGVEYAVRMLAPGGGWFSGLSFMSSGAWIEALTDVVFESGGGTVPAGTRLPGTPKFQMANVLSYDTQWGRFAPGLSLTHSYVGRSYNDLFGTVAMGDYETLDLGVRLLVRGLSFEPTLSFTATNLTDERGIAGAAGDPNIDFRDIYFIRPRALELTLGIRFY